MSLIQQKPLIMKARVLSVFRLFKALHDYYSLASRSLDYIYSLAANARALAYIYMLRLTLQCCLLLTRTYSFVQACLNIYCLYIFS